ncbi:hypothetical protein [Hyphomicrobium nitrativorans]|uniref:hypothetical protein n=1 Tax=Hyphomicrobium nitrativorans TaxID=1427356 RepID=UPI001181DD21|nr:hypothetical protein [Hyphomicrobium nitrativorans]
MSEVVKSGVPQVVAREQPARDETVSAPGAPEDVGAKTRPPSSVSLLPGSTGSAGSTGNDRSQHKTLPVAAELDRADAPPGAVRKVGDESPARASVVEKQRDRSRERRVPHVALVAVGILAAVAVGPGGTSVPQEGRRVASIVPATLAQPARGEASAVRAQPVEHAVEAAPSAPPGEHALQEREPAKERPAADALIFKNATLCTGTRCNTLLVHRPYETLRPMLQPALGRAAGIAETAVGDEFHVIAQDVVLKTPAPAETAFSTSEEKPDVPHGAEDADKRVLEIPLDALGEVEFVLLPESGQDTSRARVALRQRDGGEIARFDLKIDQTLISRLPQGENESEERRPLENDEERHGGADDEGADPEKPAVDAPPVPRTKKRAPRAERKSAPRRARTTQPVKQSEKKDSLSARAPTQRASATPPPRGLFPLQPLPSPPSKPASQRAAPAMEKKRDPEVSSNDLASQPTPRTVGRPPGFETLMSLGGGFAVEPP